MPGDKIDINQFIRLYQPTQFKMIFLVQKKLIRVITFKINDRERELNLVFISRAFGGIQQVIP